MQPVSLPSKLHLATIGISLVVLFGCGGGNEREEKILPSPVVNLEQGEGEIKTPNEIIKPDIAVAFTSLRLEELRATGKNYSLIRGRNSRPAARFEGVDLPGFIKIPNYKNLLIQEHGQTIDTWILIKQSRGMNQQGEITDNNDWIMASHAKSHDRNGVGFDIFGNQTTSLISFESSWQDKICTYSETAPRITIGEWHRITITINPSKGTSTYIDKLLAQTCLSTNLSVSVLNNEALYIGSYSDGRYPFNGDIQDLRIYNRNLAPDEIQYLPEQ